jgi:kynurenine formamidase
MFIDLTHRLNNDTPVYPGDAEIKISSADTIEQNGYLGHNLQLGTHSGTHIDAPAHMITGGKTLDKFGIDTFVGRGCYIFLQDRKFTLEAVQNADIKSGDIVIFDTQYSYHFKKPEYFTDYPVMSEEVALYLVEKGVKMVGLDTCSADNQADFPVHKILLSSDILIIENLTNIEQLTDHSFTVYALPIKLDLDGAPSRVIAVLN